MLGHWRVEGTQWRCLVQALDRIKCRILEGVEAADVRVLVLDMQGRLMLDMLGRGIEAALVNPSTLIPEPWQASGETLTGLGPDAMAVDPALVQVVQVLFLHTSLLLQSYFLSQKSGEGDNFC
jgi:hypothetical protein